MHLRSWAGFCLTKAKATSTEAASASAAALFSASRGCQSRMSALVFLYISLSFLFLSFSSFLSTTRIAITSPEQVSSYCSKKNFPLLQLCCCLSRWQNGLLACLLVCLLWSLFIQLSVLMVLLFRVDMRSRFNICLFSFFGSNFAWHACLAFFTFPFSWEQARSTWGKSEKKEEVLKTAD